MTTFKVGQRVRYTDTTGHFPTLKGAEGTVRERFDEEGKRTTYWVLLRPSAGPETSPMVAEQENLEAIGPVVLDWDIQPSDEEHVAPAVEPTTYEAMLKQGWATVKDETALKECARTLIASYARDPSDVDWEDVQQALGWALQAFGLPENFPETVHARFVEEQEAERETALAAPFYVMAHRGPGSVLGAASSPAKHNGRAGGSRPSRRLTPGPPS